VFDADENNPHYLEPLTDMGTERMVVLPLLADQALIGLLILGHRDRSEHDSAANAYVRQISDHAASALRNARVIQENRVLSYYDTLTGLPNRRLFADRLHQAMIQARRKKSSVAIGALDLDGFKRVNDTLGHRAGDRLLCQVAEALASAVRDTDAVARGLFDETDGVLSRRGSDEFTFVLTEMSHPQDAARVALRIQKALSKPFLVDGDEVFISASIGIAVYPADGNDVEEIMKNAGIALSCAKSRGRGSYQFFAPSMNIEASRKFHLAARLWRAIERDELLLHYQPVRDMGSGEVVGAEALVRWNDSEMGLVSPGEFIPVAEETKVIIPIGAWVLRHACEQLQRWQAEGFQPIRLSVNLSAQQLGDPELIELVRATLEEYGLSPAQLELEVTETAIMQDDDASLASLMGLDELGVGLVLDDFGTGYSSLSHLRRFPFERLKIDRSFVKEIPANPDDVALTRAIIAMAHSLRMGVVAEGVETQDQADLLREQGCDEFQGFLIGRPIPSEEFMRFLTREKPSDADALAQADLPDQPEDQSRSEGRSRRSG
jgi:diguanylate cyclase (GGDEF)-like protein